MFSDLPPIDVDYECTVLGHSQPQNIFQFYHSNLIREAPRGYELEPCSSRSEQQTLIDMPALIPLDCGGDSVSDSTRWSHDHTKSPWTLAPFALQGGDSGCSSWTSTSTLPGRASSISSLAEESSLSDDGSYTPPGFWSPVFVKHETHGSFRPHSPPLHLGTWKGREDAHASFPPSGSSALSVSAVQDSGCSRTGIALQDVQQYPDSYPEEHLDSTTELEAKMPYVFPLEPIDTQTRCGQFAEHHRESLVPALSEDDRLKEDSMSEDESTLNNPAQSRATQIITRQSRPPKTITKHVDKVPAKPKRRSKLGRVSKRSNTTSDTIVVSLSSKTACPHCSQALHSKSALNKHITTAHTRPFTCTFRIYGCPSTFGSKNEWKRHVSSQHLRLGFWRCNLDRCLPQQKVDGRVEDDDDDEEELIFNDFNRKDLFMQHLRRMHRSSASSSTANKAGLSTSLEDLTQRCFMAIRNPPPRSVCGFCTTEGGNEVMFEGPGAWESRMEHVGRHLESGHGREKEWVEDQNLKKWLVNEGLIDGNDTDGWHLVGLQSEDRLRKR